MVACYRAQARTSLRKSCASYDKSGGMGGISLVMQILYTAWAGFGQGGDPVAISRMVIPRLQISACVVCVCVFVSHAPCVLT